MKKAQFYMFAGIVLIASVFLIITSSSGIRVSEIGELQDYMSNYLYEGRIILNKAIRNQDNISIELMDYTENFIEYGDSKNLNIGIVFLYSRDSFIHIVNYLNEPLLISSQELYPEQEAVLDFSETVELEYKDESYEYEFTEGETELRVLFVRGK